MDTLQTTLKNLPHAPGVYIYKDRKKAVLYVGKARDLYQRVHNYFAKPSHLPEKTRQLVSRIRSIRVIPVATEFEALLLEAKLIRNYSPKYNSIAKDDKSPIYIHIQKHNVLPYIHLIRKPKTQGINGLEYFGPFASTRTARLILRMLRKSIPFCQQKTRNGKPCFYTHLGLCDPCPSLVEKMPEGNSKKILISRYQMNIKRLIWVLSGRSRKSIQSIQTDMHRSARQNKFEEAGILRDQMASLVATINTRYDPFHFEETDRLEKVPGEQKDSLLRFLLPFIPSLTSCGRIECFDISTIQGTSSVGSLIVFLDGIPHTDHYRKFKIKAADKQSDVSMMEEVVKRRFAHPEWPFPDLVLVDGGKAQVGRISSLLQSLSIPIPVIGLSKRFEQIVIKTKENRFYTKTVPLFDPSLQLMQHIRDEAHRFAHTYHGKVRSRIFAERS